MKTNDSKPLWQFDDCPDANGHITIRPCDGTPHGDTEENPIATFYHIEDAKRMLEAVNSRASDQARIKALTKALDEVESWLDGDRESAKHGEDMTEVDLDTILARLDAVQTALKGTAS